MSNNDSPVEYPEWLHKQRSWRYRARTNESGFMNRKKLVQEYAKHCVGTGQSVSFASIRAMLLFVDRGYSLGHQQIGFALKGLYANRTIPKMPNGSPVSINGTTYASARSVAEALGISPQTVLNRIASTKPKWIGWTRQTVLGSVSDGTDT